MWLLVGNFTWIVMFSHIDLFYLYTITDGMILIQINSILVFSVIIFRVLFSFFIKSIPSFNNFFFLKPRGLTIIPLVPLVFLFIFFFLL